MEDDEQDLEFEFMADGFVLQAFMLQVSLELAHLQPDPENWARRFVNTLAGRIDGNEQRMRDAGHTPETASHVHARCRERVDVLGATLHRVLQLPRS